MPIRVVLQFTAPFILCGAVLWLGLLGAFLLFLVFRRTSGWANLAGRAAQTFGWEAETALAERARRLRPGSLDEYAALFSLEGYRLAAKLRYRGLIHGLKALEDTSAAGLMALVVETSAGRGRLMAQTASRHYDMQIERSRLFAAPVLRLQVDGAPFGALAVGAGRIVLQDVSGQAVGECRLPPLRPAFKVRAFARPVHHPRTWTSVHGDAPTPTPPPVGEGLGWGLQAKVLKVYNFEPLYGAVTLRGRFLGEVNRNLILRRHLRARGGEPLPPLFRALASPLSVEEQDWLLALAASLCYLRLLRHINRVSGP